MIKRRGIFIAFFVFIVFLAGCTADISNPDTEETIKNGGAYKEEITLNKEVNIGEKIEADKKAEADKETKDPEEDSLSKEIIEIVEGDNENTEKADIESLKILSTHEIEAETLKLKEDLKIITEEVHKAGGYISANNLTNDLTSGKKLMKSELTLRIPKERASHVVDIINKTVAITGEFSTSVDVTDKYYDIEARIKNLENREDRLRKLYNSSDDINEIIAIDDKLFDVTEEREEMVQKKLRMQDRITFSRVDLSLKEVSKLSVPAFEEEKESLTAMEKIGNSITSTSKVVKNSFVGLISLFIKALPIIILAGAGFQIYRMITRKYDKIKKDKETEDNNSTNEDELSEETEVTEVAEVINESSSESEDEIKKE